MGEKYNHAAIEKKWQKRWNDNKIWEAKINSQEKKYILDMFPYPSAEGLHVGHPEGYTASDIVSRYLRMKGFNVLHPMGWDAFGLPAENYAIKTGTHPAATIKKNIDNMRQQIKSLGFSYDWSREVMTSDTDYYKWTQWIFVQLFKQGLAYEADAPINWCPSCKTGLANEEVINGTCERCGTKVGKKQIKQWLVKITDKRYIERLEKDLDKLDWPENIKLLQKNWIGRSEGATVKFKVVANHMELRTKNKERIVQGSKFKVQSSRQYIEVFTTRPDTLFGATYMVLAPEHPLVKKIITAGQKSGVEKYIKQAESKSDLERTDLAKEKTGVFTGAYAINPVNNKKIPIWIAGYVLISYGTGAIMAVPAHDERDWEFARKYDLPVREVVERGKPASQQASKPAYTGEGVGVNSGEFNGLKTEEFKKRITQWLEKNKAGKKAVNYKLRDWVFSRQRYWGEPIPIVHCKKCKENKETVLIVHGRPSKDHSKEPGYVSDENRNWIPWLKRELEKRGARVLNPRMPKPWLPVYRDWKNQVDKLEIDENSTVVGHSAGGAFVVRWLGETKKKIKKLILVAPAKIRKGGEPKAIKDYYDFKIDSSVKNHVSEIVVFTSNDKERHRKSAHEYSKLLSAKLLDLENKGHYTQTSLKSVEFPELLDEIPILPAGLIPITEKDLPLKLPEAKKYEPAGTGQSPLAAIDKWVNTKCPQCGGPAKRETNTMPQWAGSNWYWLRYCDPDNKKQLADPKKLAKWLPVDIYVGGAEHAVLHLLYARFIYKFLFDIGVVPKEVGDEPFVKLKNQGIILGKDGQKMSKSRGNVVNPDEVIKEFGADSMRMYEMFMGPFDDSKPWSTKGIVGIKRFLNRVWLVIGGHIEKNQDGLLKQKSSKAIHKTIKKVTKDINSFKFNTAVSSMMEWFNIRDWGMKLNKQGKLEGKEFDLQAIKRFIIILSPFAPHIAEELWEKLGHKKSIAYEKWPEYNKLLIIDEKITIVVQVNGKVRDNITVNKDASREEVYLKACASIKVNKYLPKGKIKTKVKIINHFVPNKIINFVV